jgi:hypothetical protein
MTVEVEEERKTMKDIRIQKFVRISERSINGMIVIQASRG